MKTPIAILLLLVACFFAPSGALADTVEDREGLFSHVTILNLEDDQLVFVFNDGRSIQKPVDTIKAVAVNAGNDSAADELTRAETLRLESKRRDAVQLYQRVVQVGGKVWIRDFALMRLVGLNADQGDLWSSYRAYSKLALTHPQLCQRIIPKRIPRKDSQVCRKILQDIDDVLSQPQPENLTAALQRLRSAILRENQTPPTPAVAAATQPEGESQPIQVAATPPPTPPLPAAAKPAPPAQPAGVGTPDGAARTVSGGSVPPPAGSAQPPQPNPKPPAAITKPAGAGNAKPPSPSAKPPAAPSPADAVLAKGRAALKEGDLAKADALLEEARMLNLDASSPAYLLLDAQIALAHGRTRQAGVQAMRIVLESPSSDEYPEALYISGRAHEELKRYSKALDLYRKCWINPKAPAELQQKAKQRVDALTSPEAASANAPRPADKTVKPGDKPDPAGGKK